MIRVPLSGLSRSGRSRWVIVAGIFFPSLAVATTSCFVAGHTFQCCAGPTAYCEIGEDVWFCTGTSDKNPVSVRTVREANPGQTGKQSATSTTILNCTITPKTCGVTPGTCIVGSPQQHTCEDTVPSGSPCTGS